MIACLRILRGGIFGNYSNCMEGERGAGVKISYWFGNGSKRNSGVMYDVNLNQWKQQFEFEQCGAKSKSTQFFLVRMHAS